MEMFEIQPLTFKSVNLKQLHGRIRMNAEDVFYFDPVIAVVEIKDLLTSKTKEKQRKVSKPKKDVLEDRKSVV